MSNLNQLKLAKDFIELSILTSPDKKFLLPKTCVNNYIHDINQRFLLEALFELIKEDKINIIFCAEEKISITLKTKNTI